VRNWSAQPRMHVPWSARPELARQPCLHARFATRAVWRQAFFCRPQPAGQGCALRAPAGVRRQATTTTSTPTRGSGFIRRPPKIRCCCGTLVRTVQHPAPKGQDRRAQRGGMMGRSRCESTGTRCWLARSRLAPRCFERGTVRTPFAKSTSSTPIRGRAATGAGGLRRDPAACRTGDARPAARGARRLRHEDGAGGVGAGGPVDRGPVRTERARRPLSR
jgi:hypothetical protein